MSYKATKIFVCQSFTPPWQLKDRHENLGIKKSNDIKNDIKKQGNFKTERTED